MGKAKAWALAARPKTLPAGAMPVVMGAALAAADGTFHGLSVLCALVGALLIQIGTNYANDYFDFVKGTDTADRVGPTRATQAGLVTPREMKWATILVLALAFVPGAYLIYRGGLPILAIGLFSVLFAILYTGGPFPLGYIGVADLFVLIFFGPVAVGGTYYVQAQHIDSIAIIAGLAPGLVSTAILTVNNLRDIEGDRVAGKKSLAVRFGRTFARGEYLLTLVAGMGVVPLAVCLLANGHWFALAASLTLLPALRPLRIVFTSTDGPALNQVLAATGKLLVIFTIVFSAGWLV
ncbi:MAG: 1,4-dihydroxy-2-naphthoate polyprenyltransferase [Candidatus Hydrogenedentes bacterium]|nr:1,4-dihydroxy-2-naphthoate polyprenyltransferase [Candidatus Hydrogenedentota bacterium]